MTSFVTDYSDLKMVRVRRGKRGHRKSRSLVFRFSRTVPKPINDLQIMENLQESSCSSFEQTEEKTVPPLKIKLPKLVYQNESIGNEDVLNIGSSEDTKSEVTKDQSSNVANLQGISEETLRRSTRRIVLRIQKEIVPDSKQNQNNDVGNPEFSSPYAHNRITGLRGGRRGRGRKRGSKVLVPPEIEKRSYTRRGRRPYHGYPRNFRIVNPTVPGEFLNNTNDFLLQYPENSVWTLVPKELLESDYFKSQVMKVQLDSPPDQNSSQFLNANAFSSSTAFSHENKDISQFKVPNPVPFTAPHWQQKNPEEKLNKRPTVIYFNTGRENFDSSLNQRGGFRIPRQPSQPNKVRNDLNYLFNKYHMLDETVISNFYDAFHGNLNDVERMLTVLVSNEQLMSSENKLFRNNTAIKHNGSGGLILDLNASEPQSNSFEINDNSNSQCQVEIQDTLSRNIIVESLRILFDEEAVLS